MSQIVYLEMTSLEGFFDEVTGRGLTEVRYSFWSQWDPVWQMKRKIRLTAYQSSSSTIIRLDYTFFSGQVVDDEDKKKVREAQEKYFKEVEMKAELTGLAMGEGEYHAGSVKW